MQGLKLNRNGDHLSISWDPPADPTKIDVIRGYVGFGRCSLHGVSKRIKVDQSADFPDHITVALPTRASLVRCASQRRSHQQGRRRESDRRTLPAVRKGSPALYGSSVRGIVGAGPRAVEVTGAVSALNAKRVCGNSTCAGETATLVVDWGHSVQRFDVTYTSAGAFHLPLAVDRGTDHLSLKVIGPLRLDSGPFQRIPVGSKGAEAANTARHLFAGAEADNHLMVLVRASSGA